MTVILIHDRNIKNGQFRGHLGVGCWGKGEDLAGPAGGLWCREGAAVAVNM